MTRTFVLIAVLATGWILAGIVLRSGTPETISSIGWREVAVRESDADPPPQQAADGQPVQEPCKDWPKPLVALFVTGRQHGYIEPCGCTGLANQKGGLARRDSLLGDLRARGWDVVPLDIGNQVRRFGRQPEIKFRSTIESLKAMQYSAVGFGPDDLKLSIGELIAVAADTDAASQPFVCANVNLLDFNDRYRVVEAGGLRIGITSVMGAGHLAKIKADDIELTPANEGLRKVLPKLLAEKVDVLVLLAHATMTESEKLAQEFPQFQLVVTAAGAGEPAREFKKVTGSTSRIMQVGTKGMYVGVVGIFGNKQEGLRIRYERLALDARFADSKRMLEVMASYQQQLKVQGLAGLGLKPVLHPTGRNFVGAEQCGECHTTAFEKWSQTPHAHATESIHKPTERAEIVRHFDPECLSCHVTGWNPQEYFPYVSGYLAYEKSAHLHGNGCENCHGPGSAHVAVELGEVEVSVAQQSALRRQMRVEKKAENCMPCHDLDNSPDFHADGAFEKYWKEVEHYGKD